MSFTYITDYIRSNITKVCNITSHITCNITKNCNIIYYLTDYEESRSIWKQWLQEHFILMQYIILAANPNSFCVSKPGPLEG